MPTGRRWVEERLAAADRVWAPRAVRVDSGFAGGRRQIDLRGLGGLTVTVEPDQFLDLGEAWWAGAPLSFVAPSTMPTSGSWLRRWSGGLLTTCGLRAVGPAEEDRGGMHGRALTIAAEMTRTSGEWVGDDFTMTIVGRMREAEIFEQNVTVERTITTHLGVSEIHLHDVIRNEGFAEESIRLLYHVNLGWPFLDAGTLVSATANPVVSHADGDWTASMPGPVVGAAELVDALLPARDESGWSQVRAESGTGSVFTLAFRPDQLGQLTIWRSPAAGSYALGIEPGTCWPSHADAPDGGKTGRVLASGESLAVDLALSIRPHDLEGIRR